MKKIINYLIVLTILSVLWGAAGCGSPAIEELDVDQITVREFGGDAGMYWVYEITSDLKMVKYDFSEYWPENGFDYFADPLPPDGEYRSEEYVIKVDEWDQMVQVLEENAFMSLPEEINSKVVISDGVVRDMEVTANGITHHSGGEDPQYAETKEGTRFTNVFNVVSALLRDYK